MIATLRQRNFALLWFGGLIALVGDWVLITALPFYIYERTGLALASGAILIAYTLPYLLLSSIAGVCVDRWDRRWTMIVSNLARSLLILLLLFVDSNDMLWLVYLVTLLQYSISTFFGPAENALLPRLVPEENLIPANALNALNNNLARLIGPPIGGALLGLPGFTTVVLLTSVAFLCAGILIGLLSVTSGTTLDDRKPYETGTSVWIMFWQEWKEGLQFVRRDRMITSIFTVVGIFTIAAGITDVLLVAFVNDVLRGDAIVFGWLLTLRGVGGLLGGIVVGQLGRMVSPARLLAVSQLANGVIMLAMFNFPSLLIALTLFALGGVPETGFVVSQQTLLQSTVSDKYRGRIFGALGTTNALLGLGGMGFAGALGDIVGVVPVLNTAAVLWLLAGMIALALLAPGRGVKASL